MGERARVWILNSNDGEAPDPVKQRVPVPVERRVSQRGPRGRMPPLFMEEMCEPGSPGSLSGEEGHSNAAGSEGDGGRHMGPRGSKRQEKNRNAARKSRRKQTERADELHQELESLEQSNSALRKEIEALQKELHLHEAVLKRHEPHCRLRASLPTSRSSTHRSVSSSTGSNSPGIPPKASNSTLAVSHSPSTSVTSIRDVKISTRFENPPLLHADLTPTRAPFPSGAGLFPVASVPGIVPLYADAAPHSLFSKEPPVSRAPPPSPVGLLNSLPSSATVAHLQSLDAIRRTSLVSTNASFTSDAESFVTAPPTLGPFYSHSEVGSSGAAVRGRLTDVPQPYLSDFSGSQSASPLLQPPPPPPEPPPQLGLGPTTPDPAPLLSRLTVPGPLEIFHSTSGGFDASLSGPVEPPPPPGESSKDLSLSELLEINEWILSGTIDK